MRGNNWLSDLEMNKMMHVNPGATQSLRPRKTEPHIPIYDFGHVTLLESRPYLSNRDPDSSFPASPDCFNMEME